jgi:hypothetical protein
MPFPLAAPLIGAGIGALGSIFGGGPEDPLRPGSRQFFEENIQGMGGAGAQAITGFDPTTGQFGDPSGPFAGPLAEGFDPSSIERFMNPFLGEAEGVLGQQHERNLLLARRDAQQAAAMTGSGRGSRAGVALGERQGAADRGFMESLVNLRLGGFREAGNLALGAQPFRNEALGANQALRRFGAGMGAANFGFGSHPSQFMTAEAATGEEKPNILSGIIGGGIAGAGFMGGGGGGSPLNAGQIGSISPPQTVNPFQMPGNVGLPTSIGGPGFGSTNFGLPGRNPMFGR